MTLDITKPVQTRSGLPAEILRTDLRGNYPIVAVVPEAERDGVYSYTIEGTRHNNPYCPTPLDLINAPDAPESVTQWFVVRRSSSGRLSIGLPHSSSADAEKWMKDEYHATGLCVLPITITLKDGKVTVGGEAEITGGKQ